MMLRPIRPKPLIPTLTDMQSPPGQTFHSTISLRDVPDLQPAHAGPFCRRFAVLPVSGPSIQEVHRHPAPASRIPADHLQHRCRRVDLDSRRVGRRGADRARAGRGSQGALSASSPVPVDDDDRRTAGGAPQPLRGRRGLLLSVRLDLHRPPHAAAGAAAALHHDGDRDLAEPAARMPAPRREDGDDQRPHLVAVASAIPPDSSVLPPRARRRRSLLRPERGVGPPPRRPRRRRRRTSR